MLADIDTAASVGLAALKSIQDKRPVTAASKKLQLQKLNPPARAELTLAILPYIRKLVETAATSK
jgi:hypothetical protein